MLNLNPDFIEKSRKIKLVIFDVDGILTDGRIYMDDNSIEIKAFHVLDGLGIQWLQKSGIDTAAISGRAAKSVQYRLEQLGIAHIFLGCADKLPVYEKLLKKLDLNHHQTAYMGDDLPDLPLLRLAGLPVTVPSAVIEVLDSTPFVTRKKAGKGAVRELCEAILKAQSRWETILAQY